MKNQRKNGARQNSPWTSQMKNRCISRKQKIYVGNTSAFRRVVKSIVAHDKDLAMFATGDGDTFRLHIKPKWSAIDG